jgi:hypothetical protein
MTWRRWAALSSFALAASLVPRPAAAQLAPTGGHYAARASDTGYAGAVNSSGGYGASVPLDLPGARGGLPIPLQIVYGERGVGAAGLGWDVPLSYIRRDNTFAHRRPVGTPDVDPQAREQVSLVLNGQRLNLVQTASGWVAQRDAPDLDIREQGDGTWVVYDGQGRTYLFAVAAPALAGAGIWHLASITGPGGNNVSLTYAAGNPSVPGAPDASRSISAPSSTTQMRPAVTRTRSASDTTTSRHRRCRSDRWEASSWCGSTSCSPSRSRLGRPAPVALRRFAPISWGMYQILTQGWCGWITCMYPGDRAHRRRARR